MSKPMSKPGQSLDITADNGDSIAADAGQQADRTGQSDGRAGKTAVKAGPPAREFGGPDGLEPTRYGDWEHKGRCIDF